MRPAICGERKRRSRFSALEVVDLLGDPRLELGVPALERDGLLDDGVVEPLDPGQRPHPRHELGLVEGLGDEVVGADLEGAQPLPAPRSP